MQTQSRSEEGHGHDARNLKTSCGPVQTNSSNGPCAIAEFDNSTRRRFHRQGCARIFGILDTDNDGKVTVVEFQINKVQAFFWRSRQQRGEIKPLRFEDTLLSREFFDKADFGHKGYLDGLDMVEAFQFGDIDTKQRGYFEFADLVSLLKKISR